MIRQAFDPNRVGVVSKALGAGRPGPIREVGSPPITWKDLHSTLREKGLLERFTVPLSLLLLGVAYFLAWWYEGLGELGFHVGFVAVVILIGLLRTAVLSGMTIAREKESRTLPILLMVPLSDTQILWQKIRAILRKTAAIWIVLAGHVAVFSLAGVLSPLLLPVMCLFIVPALFFLFGLGLFFSSLCRSTTAATIWSCVIPVFLWFFNPFLAFGNPIVLSCAAMVTLESRDDSWPRSFYLAGVSIVPIAYIGIGLILMVIGGYLMRNRMFESRG